MIPGELMTVAGAIDRPMFERKSWFGMNLLLEHMRRGGSVVYLNLEAPIDDRFLKRIMQDNTTSETTK